VATWAALERTIDPYTCAWLTREVILRSPATAPENRLLLGDYARKEPRRVVVVGADVLVRGT
jgi:hypothetical protein